jgi:F0F1-type ATP synthase gamma subunit
MNLMPDILLLERKHRIYSVFMNTLIYDVVNKNLIPVDEPDVNRMAAQVKPYLYLRKMDLSFSGIDKRFVDFYPQYVNYAVDPAVKTLVDKLISAYMAKNTDPTVEAVYE